MFYKIFSIVIMVLVVTMLLGTAFRHLFDKLTMTNNWDISTQPGWFVALYIFFSPIMFLFYKPIREFRKIRYIKYKIYHYEYWSLVQGSYEKDDKYYDYIKYKRYLKLKTLQRKSKRLRLWK